MNCKNASQVQEIAERQPLSGSNALAPLLVALHYRLQIFGDAIAFGSSAISP